MDQNFITDANLDYYGETLAVCTINSGMKLYATENNDINHKGAVLCCSWGHPRYVTQLVSGGMDGVLYLYANNGDKHNWKASQEFSSLGEAITGVSFSPDTYGLNIACITSKVLIYSYNETEMGWDKIVFPEISKSKLNAISWCKCRRQLRSGLDPLLVVGGDDGSIHVLELLSDQYVGKIVAQFQTHSSPILSVDWSSEGDIVSCDKQTCLLWQKASERDNVSNIEAMILTETTGANFLSATFNSLGNMLCVSCSTGRSILYRRNVLGKWVDVIS